MSILADFGAGMAGSLVESSLANKQEMAERARVKAEEARRRDALREDRKYQERTRLTERNQQLADRASYDPTTNMMTWVDDSGKTQSRPATPAERQMFEAQQAAATRDANKALLDEELIRARIGSANRANRGSGGRASEGPKPRPTSLKEAVEAVTGRPFNEQNFSPESVSADDMQLIQDIQLGVMAPQDLALLRRKRAEKEQERLRSVTAFNEPIPSSSLLP